MARGRGGGVKERRKKIKKRNARRRILRNVSFQVFHIDKNEKRVMIKFRVHPALHSVPSLSWRHLCEKAPASVLIFFFHPIVVQSFRLSLCLCLSHNCSRKLGIRVWVRGREVVEGELLSSIYWEKNLIAGLFLRGKNQNNNFR